MPRLYRRLRALLGPGRDRGLVEELRFHQEQLEAEGASPSQAARALGNDLRLRERAREAWGWLWLEQLGQDLRCAARQARRAPGSTAAAVLVLALGIGVGTALFSVLDAALLRPLPYAQPQTLVQVQGETGLQKISSAPGTLELGQAAWLDQLRTISDWATTTPGQITIGAAGEHLPLRVAAAEVSPSFFRLLGVEVEGRGFVPGDAATGSAHVAILRGDLAARWGGTRALLGQSLRLNGTPYRIIGVAPTWVGIPAGTQIWMPLPQPWNFATDPIASSVVLFNSYARLRPGATPAAARADLIHVQAPLPQVRDEIAVIPLQQSQTAETASVLWLLLGAVGLVLLIACANVAGIQLTQALRRRHETAVRSALGASRGRLARQHLAESVALALAGGSLGCGLAGASLGALRSFLPEKLALAGPLGLDHRVLLFALAAALASGLGAGLAPVLALGRDPQPRLQGSGAAPSAARRLRAALVVGEVALAMVLLASAGLLLASLARLDAVNPGFATANLLTAKFDLSGPHYSAPADRVRAYRELNQRLAALPGVAAATLGTNLPLHTGPTFSMAVRANGATAESTFTSVSPGYFSTLGIPLLAGRDFSPSDRDGSPPVVILSRSLAAALWPGPNVVGQSIPIPSRPGTTLTATVVGVASDTHLRLDGPAAHNLYFPLAQSPSADLAIVLRAHSHPEALAAPLRRALAGVDRDLAASDVATMRALVRADTTDQRFRSLLLALFAALALGLSVAGLGAALAHSTALRTREIGVRLALGARPGQAAGLVLWQGLRLAALGIVLGSVATLAAARLLRNFLFGIGPYDPTMLAAAALLLAAASWLACWLPARRAARVDPMAALRCD